MNVEFLYGILNLSFWSYVVATFLMVQFTFMGVTLYLHRDATHRSLDLHPAHAVEVVATSEVVIRLRSL